MTGAKEHPPGGAESVIDMPSLHPMNPKWGGGTTIQLYGAVGHEAVENPVGYCDRRTEAVEGPLGY